MMISVIVPNYNHVEYLPKRLESIFNQTFEDFEVILLDDHSTDDSVLILNQYADHPKVSHIVINDTNSGTPFAQWKRGIDLAVGEYIWIAESDDWSDPNFLVEMVELANKNPGSVVLYSNSSIVSSNGDFIRENFSWTEGLDDRRWRSNYTNHGLDECRNYLCYKNTIPNASAVLFRRATVQKFNWVFHEFKMAGDWLFWIKMLEHGNITYTPACLNYFRNSTNNTRKYDSLSKKLIMAIEELEILNYLSLRNIIELKSRMKRVFRLRLKIIILLIVGPRHLPKTIYAKGLKTVFNVKNKQQSIGLS